MARTIVFSFHAVERMRQRLNINVDPKQEVDISSTFRLARTYRHYNGNMVQAWVARDPATTVVLIVDQQSGVVLTVYHQMSDWVRDLEQVDQKSSNRLQ